MLGNGVKRKLDQAGDGLEGCPRASYSLQRQTLLNMSLMKLYGPRSGAQLCLQRRVLINNVIRRIHSDFRQEGGLRTILFSVTTATPGAGAGELSPLPPGPSLGLPCLTPASLLEDDPPLLFSLPGSLRPPASPSSRDSFSTALEEIEELCSSSSSPPPAPPLFTHMTLKEEVQGEGEQEEEEVEAKMVKSLLVPPPPMPPSPSVTDALSCHHPSAGGLLTDFALEDVLFTDIDTSMYDLSPCSPTPSKMADDLVRTISSYGGAAVGSSQNQPFRMDLAELDHIMEVLVGS